MRSDKEKTPEAHESNKSMNERKASWAKLGHVDSLNLEAGRIASTKSHAFKVLILLSLHAL